MMNITPPLVLLVAGAAAFGIAALLWALRISRWRTRRRRKYREQNRRPANSWRAQRACSARTRA